MTDKQIIDGKECRYWFRPNPGDYRKCSLRGKNDNCDEITDCFIKELLGKLALKEQECKVLALDARVADNHLQHRIEMCDLLREKLKAKEQECDKLKFNLKGAGILGLMKRNVQLKKALDDIVFNISDYQ